MPIDEASLQGDFKTPECDRFLNDGACGSLVGRSCDVLVAQGDQPAHPCVNVQHIKGTASLGFLALRRLTL